MKHFTVIEFLHENKCLDYPKKLPIPRIGERVLFNDYIGRVADITHNIQSKVIEIRIKITNNP